jgi:methyl-accepting chemotaxis protein
MRWNIGRRLAALWVVTLIATAAIAGIGYLRVQDVSRQSALALQVADTRATVKDAQHTVAVVYADAHILENAGGDVRKAALDEMDAHAGEMREHFDALRAVRIDADVDGQLAGTFLPAIQSVLDDVKTIDGVQGALTATHVAAVDVSWSSFDSASDALGSALDAQATREESSVATKSTAAQRIFLLIAALALLLTSGAAVMVGRAIAGPVRRTRELLERVSTGDFTQRLELHGNNDLSDMANAVNTTLDRVGAALGAIAGEADSLRGASGLLTQVNSRMGGSADETTTRAASVSAAAEQISRNIETVSTGAEQMGASIREIAGSAVDAARVAQGAVTVAGQANEAVSRLGQSSAEIGNVIKTITSIAEQTNLLALNATIEAARAGESGRGFAVVASEVKDLAQATAKATEDVSGRIQAIQNDTGDAVAAIGQIARIIEQINGYSTAIASAVEEQTATADEIGRNVSEAAVGSGEIARNITAVAGAARSAGAGVAESQQSTEELARMSAQLHQVVSQFQVVS